MAKVKTKKEEVSKKKTTKEEKEALKEKFKNDPAMAFMEMECQRNPETIMMDEAEAITSSRCIVPGFKRTVGVGVPHGTMIIIHGPAAGGKTALQALMICSFQNDNYPTRFYDIECAADILKAQTEKEKQTREQAAEKKMGMV